MLENNIEHYFGKSERRLSSEILIHHPKLIGQRTGAATAVLKWWTKLTCKRFGLIICPVLTPAKLKPRQHETLTKFWLFSLFPSLFASYWLHQINHKSDFWADWLGFYSAVNFFGAIRYNKTDSYAGNYGKLVSMPAGTDWKVLWVHGRESPQNGDRAVLV